MLDRRVNDVEVRPICNLFKYCTKWLAIANEARTIIIGLNEDIFIPELNY